MRESSLCCLFMIFDRETLYYTCQKYCSRSLSLSPSLCVSRNLIVYTFIIIGAISTLTRGTLSSSISIIHFVFGKRRSATQRMPVVSLSYSCWFLEGPWIEVLTLTSLSPMSLGLDSWGRTTHCCRQRWWCPRQCRRTTSAEDGRD